MPVSSEKSEHTIELACRRIGRRSANLFLTRQLWCSGAVLVVLNRALQGDLTQDQAIRLAAGLGEGMGGSGCLCGGLNGGALALGLILGHGRLSPGGDQKVMQATRQLHDQFKAVHGSACCRILTKKEAQASEDQYRMCARRTSTAAELSAAMILDQRPDLLRKVDWGYLSRQDSVMTAGFKIVADRLRK